LDGLGIDISEDAILYAQSEIDKRNLNHKVHVMTGDFFRIDYVKNNCADVDLITCMFVLHEFLSKGRENVINLLSKLKSSFPDTHLIVCELSKFSPTELRKTPSSIAEHHLFHALSNQTIMTVLEWRKVFKESGYQIIEEKRYDFAGQAYFVVC